MVSLNSTLAHKQKGVSRRDTLLENWPIQTGFSRAEDIKKSVQEIFGSSVF